MKDTQNVILVLLVVTAAVLAAMLVFSLNSSPAYADASLRGGDYILVNGAHSKLKDVIYIIDVPQKRMNVYEVNLAKNAIDIVDSVDLTKMFAGK